MKKFLVAMSLVASGLVSVQVPASASVRTPEPIARKMVVTSPQTTGPLGSNLSWGLDRIDQRTPVTSPRSYSYGSSGVGVNIYVLDSGVDGDHPEFGSRVANGWSYRSSSSALLSYQWALAANLVDPETGISPCTNDGTHEVNPAVFDLPSQPDLSDVGTTDNDGHGTHVAGIAAGDATGVAKNATIIPVRALDSCGSGTPEMILEGLAWIKADHDSGEKAVLNLSVGFDVQFEDVDNAIIGLMNEGIVVTAAAGNSAVSACNSTPASTPGTISVGSSTISDLESEFSNYGNCVDVFAPGSSIVSSYPYLSGYTDTYAIVSGTSMSAPFVTGTVARYLETMSTAPISFSSGQSAVANWLLGNATPNLITTHDVCRKQQTPNRLLFVPATTNIQLPSAPTSVSGLSILPSNNGAVVSWQVADTSLTYKVTTVKVTEPCTNNRATSCQVVGASSCTITGLVNGSSYSISVSAINSDGASIASTGMVVAGLAPTSPSGVAAKSANKSVRLSWAASTTPNVTYVVTSVPASAGCTSTVTTCTISGLKNGTQYSFSVVATSPTGLQSSATVAPVVRPGFTIKKSLVKKGSRTVLTWLITTPSKGKKTWSESGSCSISAGRLVAPKKAATCIVRLTVAKAGAYPKMATSLKVTVK